MAAIPENTIRIGPQPGPQTEFLSTPVDIAVYGGAAGSGKTFAVLLEPLRHISNKAFGCVIFRRTMKQVKQEGGIWDAAMSLYPVVGGRPNLTESYWTFPAGSSIQFAGLEHEQSKFDYQGAEIALLIFEELTHFTEGQFWYLLSRNRSTCGVRPYVRATTNPGPGWVKRLLAPWVDKSFPEPAKSGEIRWFIRENDKIVWCCSQGTPFAKSITFIAAKLSDNPALIAKDPGYEANLHALNEADRRALLHGDWDVVLPNRVLDGFDEHRNQVPAFDPPADWRRYAGIDFGLINGAEIAAAIDHTTEVRDETGKITRQATIHIYKENWPGHSRKTEARAKDIRDMIKPGSLHAAYGGNRTTEQDSRELLRKHGIPATGPTVKDVATQYQCCNDAFLDGTLVIHDSCTQLLDMIARFQRKLDSDGSPTDDFDDGPFHLCACLRYLISMLRPPKSKRTLEFT